MLWSCYYDNHRELPGATPHTSVNGERAYTVRNYTIVGNYKVGFPQWRVMRCSYPDHGHPLLKAGDEVFVLGRSQKRGFLIIEHSGRQIHMAHSYTELRVCTPCYSLKSKGVEQLYFSVFEGEILNFHLYCCLDFMSFCSSMQLTPPTSPAPQSAPKLARATPPQGYSDL